LREARCLIKKHKPDYFLVEDASSGTALGQNIKQTSECKVKFIRQPPNMSKKDRLLAQLHTFENGKIRFPQDAPWLDEFERELLGFPHVRHDDQVDALTIFLAEANAKKYNEVY
jgi:predicted phage terminase large subunit-like protein